MVKNSFSCYLSVSYLTDYDFGVWSFNTGILLGKKDIPVEIFSIVKIVENIENIFNEIIGEKNVEEGKQFI